MSRIHTERIVHMSKPKKVQLVIQDEQNKDDTRAMWLIEHNNHQGRLRFRSRQLLKPRTIVKETP